MKKKWCVKKDAQGKDVVVVNDIRFKGKRAINWEDVEAYLKQYAGECFEVVETGDIIYIGRDLSDEYTGSVYTRKLRGTVAKAKANAVLGIPQMIEIATGRQFRENKAIKHNRNAALGWYRYDSKFALPILGENGQIERYNVFHASLLVRHDENGKKYLYDIIDIKKETSNPFAP